MTFDELSTSMAASRTSDDQRRAAVLAVLRLAERHADPEGAHAMLEHCGLLDDAVALRARLAKRCTR